MPNTEHRGSAHEVDKIRRKERDDELADRKREAERQQQAKFAKQAQEREQAHFDRAHASHVSRAAAQREQEAKWLARYGASMGTHGEPHKGGIPYSGK